MENDSIRASGSNTLVDIWVDGKLRAICVTRAAIEKFLEPAPAPATENGRREFVRVHLRQIVASTKARLRELGASTEAIVIDAQHLGSTAAGGDRRRVERRKIERRKTVTPKEALPHGERRGGDRRKIQRRGPSPKKEGA